jgi:hypothetical protein
MTITNLPIHPHYSPIHPQNHIWASFKHLPVVQLMKLETIEFIDIQYILLNLRVHKALHWLSGPNFQVKFNTPKANQNKRNKLVVSEIKASSE